MLGITMEHFQRHYVCAGMPEESFSSLLSGICCIPTASMVPADISLACRYKRITQRLWESQH